MGTAYKFGKQQHIPSLFRMKIKYCNNSPTGEIPVGLLLLYVAVYGGHFPNFLIWNLFCPKGTFL